MPHETFNRPTTRPPTPSAAKALSAQCKYCKAAQQEPVRLVASDGGASVFVCPRCLRSLLLRKADLSERRNSLLLEAFAEENGLQVWFSDHVGYALPPLTPQAS